MAIKIRGFDQITAWGVGIVTAGALFGVIFWLGKSSASKEAAEKLRLTKEAEKSLAEHHNTKAKLHQPEANAHEKATLPDTQKTSSSYAYSGTTAPWRWADMGWPLCGTGKQQSPIDISGAKESPELKSLKVNYLHGVTELSFANQTFSGSIENGSWLDVDGDRYDLKNVYFRTPSEHRVNGLPYELELQLLHQELSGRQIMLSILVTAGKKNEHLEPILSSLPRYEGEQHRIERLNWSAVLPSKRLYWQYRGSLTTPPCSEGITWIVLTTPVYASTAQIEAFQHLQKNNARAVFPLGQRALHRSNR